MLSVLAAPSFKHQRQAAVPDYQQQRLNAPMAELCQLAVRHARTGTIITAVKMTIGSVVKRRSRR
jgi:hypothetical protein